MMTNLNNELSTDELNVVTGGDKKSPLKGATGIGVGTTLEGTGGPSGGKECGWGMVVIVGLIVIFGM